MKNYYPILTLIAMITVILYAFMFSKAEIKRTVITPPEQPVRYYGEHTGDHYDSK